MSQVFNLTSNMANLAKNKALVIPTNQEMANLYKALGIVFSSKGKSVNRINTPVLVSEKQLDNLKFFMARFAIKIKTFESQRFLKPTTFERIEANIDSCNLLARTTNFKFPLKSILHRSRSSKVAAQKRNLLTYPATTTMPSYFDLGCGYNTITGMPVYLSGTSGVDPGILAYPIFEVDYYNTSSYGSVTASTGCSSTATSISSYSSTQTQSSLTTSLSVNAKYETYAFKGKANYASYTYTYSASTAYTFSEGQQISYATYSIPPTGNVMLTDAFIEALTPIYNYVVNNDTSQSIDASLANFLLYYGTHYINEATAGAFANLFLQTSTTQQQSVTNSGYSFSTSLSGTYGLVASGSVSDATASTADKTVYNACSSGSRRYQQVPGDVEIPYSSNSFDCSGWASAVSSATIAETSQWAQIVGDIQPITDLLALSSLNWPSSWTQAGRTLIATTIDEYIISCGDSSLECFDFTPTCVSGTYGSSVSDCNSCYSSGNSCSVSTTSSCDSTTGACTCNTGWDGSSCSSCSSGYYGSACSACNCQNGGSCDDGISGTGACTCTSGWTGTSCTTADPGSCTARLDCRRRSLLIDCKVSNNNCNSGYSADTNRCTSSSGAQGCRCECSSGSVSSGYGSCNDKACN